MVYLVLVLLAVLVVGMLTGKTFKVELTVQHKEDPDFIEELKQRKKEIDEDFKRDKEFRAGMQDVLNAVHDSLGVITEGGDDFLG